ncbi:MAG: hypothetical protein F7C08_04060 [Desulfurococcales archaeon]|nr:hypothetical protein [Desulfurococcales archaeon]
MGIEPKDGLREAYNTLSILYKRRGIAGVHALVQYTVAAYLYKKGYDIQVERLVGNGLRADIYGEAPWGRIIVEVETGFIPHNMLLYGEAYMKARTSYKLLSYSTLTDEFYIAIPASTNPATLLPRWILREPKQRGPDDVDEARRLLESFYPHHSNLLDRISDAKLNGIYTVSFNGSKINITMLRLSALKGKGAPILYII